MKEICTVRGFGNAVVHFLRERAEKQRKDKEKMEAQRRILAQQKAMKKRNLNMNEETSEPPRLAGYPIDDSFSKVQVQLVDVQHIYVTTIAFAALKVEGSVVTWGGFRNGGNSSKVQDQLVDVQHVYATNEAFAALKVDTVVAWGGDNDDQARVVATPLAKLRENGAVTSIFPGDKAIAALKPDRSVVAWGSKVPPVVETALTEWIEDGTVLSTISNEQAIAALKADGGVVAWGVAEYGGDCSNIQEKLAADVQSIYSTTNGFAALKADGSVAAWGGKAKDQAKAVSELLSKLQKSGVVTSITCNDNAIAALKADGSVVTWGCSTDGGDGSTVKEQLAADVQSIHSANDGFAALKADGSMVAWGNAKDQAKAVSEPLTKLQESGVVTSITRNDNAIAALKADGSVVAWGAGPEYDRRGYLKSDYGIAARSSTS